MAETLGFCRLYGVDLNDEDGHLPMEVSTVALEELTNKLERSYEEFKSFVRNHSDSNDADEFESFDRSCLVLDLRMRAWAVEEATEESAWALREVNEPNAAASVEERLAQYRVTLDKLDGLLQENVECLSTVAGCYQLENWRNRLAAKYQIIAWWLDGRLEEAARRNELTIPFAGDLETDGELAEAEERPHVVPVRPAIPSETPIVSRSVWLRRAAQLAIAASLLICGMLLDQAFFRGTSIREVAVLKTTGSAEFVGGRGDESELMVQVSSPFRGFVTAVALAPDRSARVFPVLGADDIRVDENARSGSLIVPNETTMVVAVVTETPAAEPMRRFIRDRAEDGNTPQEASLLRDHLQTYLMDMGYRRLAFTVLEVPSQSP
jgi:hypothetical protein